MNKIPVGVLGASGYVGRELCALLNRHPSFELAFATANEQRGATERLGGRDVTYVDADSASMNTAELVFSALPHGASRQWVAAARESGARVIDLSSDLRPGNDCAGAPYGLTELARQQIKPAEIVANPGCYPTSILFAIAPAVSAGILAPGSVIQVCSASGVTGAGNSPKRELLFAEIAQDFRAYAGGNTHRHLNEMRATLATWGVDADIAFTPHLLPVARGILSTITLELEDTVADPLTIWKDVYSGEPFLEVTAAPPSLRDVVGRNVVRMSVMPLASVRRPMLQVVSTIDNLLKGAAGQAIQNANLMFDIPETAGLPA